MRGDLRVPMTEAPPVDRRKLLPDSRHLFDPARVQHGPHAGLDALVELSQRHLQAEHGDRPQWWVRLAHLAWWTAGDGVDLERPNQTPGIALGEVGGRRVDGAQFAVQDLNPLLLGSLLQARPQRRIR